MNLQVESQRTELLKHPLVYKLIEDKWSRYGRVLFYTALSFHIAFVIFLMAFSLTVLNPFSLTCTYDLTCMLPVL
jgi:transient receptor potential cation channel subfamily A protein 1